MQRKSRARIWVAGSLAAISTLAASATWAGNETSGGGTGIILPDSSVVLSDPYRVITEGDRPLGCQNGVLGSLSEELQSAVRFTGKLMARYGWTTTLPRFLGPEQGWSEIADFFESAILRDVSYCFVDELERAHSLPEVVAPEGATSEQLAYTEGAMTFIRKDLFVRMNVKEQVKLLIHERLHAVAGNVPHEPIIAITNGVDALLSKLALQRSGDRTPLSATERGRIQAMMLQAHLLGLTRNRTAGEGAQGRLAPADGLLSPHGGWIARTARVSDRAFVGIGSIVGPNIDVEEDASIVFSNVCGTLLQAGEQLLGSDVVRPRQPMASGSVSRAALIRNSSLVNCPFSPQILDGARIVDSAIVLGLSDREMVYPETLTVGVAARILNSRVIGPGGLRGLDLGDRAEFRNVSLAIRDESFLDFYNSTLKLELEDGAVLMNLGPSWMEGQASRTPLLNTPLLGTVASLTIAPRRAFDFGGRTLCELPRRRSQDGRIQGDRRIERVSDIQSICPY